MGPLPLLLKEFSILPRRNGYHVRRSVHLWLAGLLVMVVLLFGMLGDAQTAGLYLFQWITWMLLLIFGMAAPLSTGQSMFQERRQRTLPLLYLTDLTHRDIVLGKGLSGFLQLAINLLAILPMYILCVTLGGVGTQQVLTAFAVLLSLLYTGSSVGLLMAGLFKRERAMVGWMVFLGLVYYGVIPLVAGLGVNQFGWPADVQIWTSTVFAVQEVGRGVNLQPVWVHVGVVAATGTVLLPLILLFGRGRMDEAAEDTGMRSAARASGLSGKALTALASIQNPGGVMRWRDHLFRYGGFEHEIKVGAIIMALVAVIAGVVGWFATKQDLMNTVMATFAAAGITACFFFVILGVSRGANAFDTERQTGVLEVLFTTPMEPRYVVRGKFLAMLRSLCPWLGVLGAIAIIAAHLVYFAAPPGQGFNEAIRTVLFGIYGACFLLSPVLFISALGMALSLSMRPGLALGTSFGVFLLWCGCFRNMLAVPFLFMGGMVGGLSMAANETIGTAIMLLLQALPLVGLDVLAMFITLGVVESRLKTVVVQKKI